MNNQSILTIAACTMGICRDVPSIVFLIFIPLKIKQDNNCKFVIVIMLILKDHAATLTYFWNVSDDVKIL